VLPIAKWNPALVIVKLKNFSAEVAIDHNGINQRPFCKVVILPREREPFLNWSATSQFRVVGTQCVCGEGFEKGSDRAHSKWVI
jgi:hypothetical protein